MIWVPKHLIDSIKAHEPLYRALSFRDQFAIAWMVFQFSTGGYQHKHRPSSIYMPDKIIKELWSGAARMRDVIRHRYFIVIAGGNYPPMANAWCLQEYIQLALDQALRYRGKTEFVDQEGKKVNLKANGVMSKRMVANGSRLASDSKWGADPSTLIQVNTGALEAHIASLVLDLNAAKKDQPEIVDFLNRQLRQSGYILLLTRLRSDGLIPMSYQQCSTGRIFDLLHLQGLSRDLRKVAFSGMYDYDISNCHFTLMQHFTAKQDLDLPHIKHYLENKLLVRNTLASDLGASIDMVKASLIALAFGAKLSGHSKTALCEILQADKVFRFIKHPLVINLYKDIQIASKVIIETSKNPQGRIVNALGLAYSKKDASSSSQLAHILQGAEASILLAVINRLGDAVVLPMHDGWICKDDLDVQVLEKLIQVDTGYEVLLQKEGLKSPVLHNEMELKNNSQLNQLVTSDLLPSFTSYKTEQKEQEDEIGEWESIPINPPPPHKRGGLILSACPQWNCEEGVIGIKRRH